MNNALWSPRGARAGERTHAAGYTSTLNMKANELVESSKQTEVYLRTQLALHIRFTEYTGIYNVRTGFVDKQDGELTAKMCGSPQYQLIRGFSAPK